MVLDDNIALDNKNFAYNNTDMKYNHYMEYNNNNRNIDYTNKDINIIDSDDYKEAESVNVDTYIGPYTGNTHMDNDFLVLDLNPEYTIDTNHMFNNIHALDKSAATISDDPISVINLGKEVDLLHTYDNSNVNGRVNNLDFNKTFKRMKSRYGCEGMLMSTRLYF
jgi:hypothetical protein